MNRAAARAIHRAICRDSHCGSCETAAENQAADDAPDYDTDAAANQYERHMGL